MSEKHTLAVLCSAMTGGLHLRELLASGDGPDGSEFEVARTYPAGLLITIDKAQYEITMYDLMQAAYALHTTKPVLVDSAQRANAKAAKPKKGGAS